MRKVLITAALVASVAPAAAQDRSPALRQALLDLGYVLGESHALRQACRGETDQHWRSRMIRLIDLERPDVGLQGRLQQSFNTGYASARGAHPACTPASRRAEAEAAVRGRGLAVRLAAAERPAAAAPPEPATDPMAEDQPPR